jgi:tRNA uridine 5-carboxymethylaminomethyl modification enzyme
VQYIHRQDRDIERLRADEALIIPAGFDYSGISGLSNELTAKLKRATPSNIHQAGQIEGMTPAALLLIIAHVRRPLQQNLA